MATENQPQRAVLIAPSDEQAWPSFHIVEDLKESFLAFLKQRNIEVVLPPEELSHKGPRSKNLAEIEVAERHSVPELEQLLREFLSTIP